MNSLENKNKKTIQHPLFGVSIGNWIKLLDKNGGIDKNYLGRAAFITLLSVFTAPARMIFNIKYGLKIEKTDIKNPPVFIIGHWRSGTTYLHELMSQDPQFCYVSLWNTLLPDSFLIFERMKYLFSRFLPSERPMDSIKVEIDGPYEEEAGIAVLCLWSFFHCLHFPKNAEEQYLKSIHYQDLKIEEINQWKKAYLRFMKTITYTNNGKRLLLKDPANTARIPLLLELFPNAKFIHIYRNPYKIYLSTKKMRKRVLSKLALQDSDEEEIENQVIENYKRLMKSYFEQKKLIPKDRLVEIRYENLVSDPLKQIKQIYSTINLSGSEKALPGMMKYLEKKKNYKTNVYNINNEIIQHIYDKWNFTIDLWGYKPPN